MTSISHGSPSTPSAAPPRRRWQLKAVYAEMWASIAISVMWLAVLVDALWGPNFVSTSSGSSTSIPSAIFLGLFALFGTRVVAKYGFRRSEDS